MCTGAEAAVIGLMTASTVQQQKASSEAAHQQDVAMQQQQVAQAEAKDLATKQQATSEQNINRVRQKAPDVGAIQQAAEAGAKGGVAGTMLTGPQGVDVSALQLGKNTLLGG